MSAQQKHDEILEIDRSRLVQVGRVWLVVRVKFALGRAANEVHEPAVFSGGEWSSAVAVSVSQAGPHEFCRLAWLVKNGCLLQSNAICFQGADRFPRLPEFKSQDAGSMENTIFEAAASSGSRWELGGEAV